MDSAPAAAWTPSARTAARSPRAGDRSDDRSLVDRDALETVMRQLPLGSLGTYMAAALFFVWHWAGPQRHLYLWWAASIWLVETVVVAVIVRYHRHRDAQSVRTWAQLLAVTHGLLGALWASGMLLERGVGAGTGADERGLLLLLVFLCANSAAAVTAFSGFRSLFGAFLGPMWTAATVILALDGQWVLAVGSVTFVGLMFGYGRQSTRSLREAISLRHTTAALAEQLHLSESFVRAVLDGAGEAIWTVAEDGTVHTANPAAVDLLGRDGGPVVGQELFRHIDGLEQAARAGGGSFETIVAAADGQVRPVIVTVSVVEVPAGRRFTVLARDIAERKALEDRLAFDANHDALTGLCNRHGFFRRAAQLLAGAAPSEPIALVFVDLDRFKQVNDGLGHATGDALLAEVGERLRSHTRDTDLVARLGGDEFVLLLPHPPERDDLEDLGGRLIASLERPFSFEGVEARVSASIGIARMAAAATTPDQLLANADVAMYRAKQNGRRQVTFFDDELQRDVTEHLGVEQAFRRALHRRELEAWGQPIVALPSGRVVGVELLSRWRRRGIGIVGPDVFVPIAEEAGLGIELGRWVLARAADVLEDWADQPGLADAYVTVNISGRHLVGGHLVDDLHRSVVARGIDPARLVVELTETELARDLEGAARALQEVRALGVGVAIDDFGTGYSSLAYLQQLPATTLKVDRSFVARVDVDRRQEAIVAAVVSLADAFGLRVVAEGIETPAQAQAVSRLGAGFGQGFHFSRPAPLAELSDRLADAAAASALAAPS